MSQQKKYTGVEFNEAHSRFLFNDFADSSEPSAVVSALHCGRLFKPCQLNVIAVNEE